MRKTALIWLLMILILTLALPAQAVDGLSFAEGCKLKTSSSVTMYETIDETTTLYPGRTLSAGTYLKKAGNNAVTEANPGMTYIVCCPDGDSENRVYGYISSSAITSATVSYTLSTGKTVSIPEALMHNKSALDFYLSMEYGEASSDDVVIDDNYDENLTPENPDSTPGLTDAEWYARMAKYSAANGVTTGTVYTDEEGNVTPVSINILGLARSEISINGEKKWVPTTALSWDHEVSEDKVLAVINAQKQGYAFLRAKKSTKAFSMDHCITNSVVRVISYGKNWCLVDYHGLRGYVQTGALTFHANNQIEYQPGLLSYKGRTYSKNGTTTVNIRAKAVNGSRILDNLVVGTPVSVTGTTGKWSEVDCNGYHCYVLSEFVTITEE